tara:strand:+ start:239 stop:511 length:273 start_codon:yes stop_codon:yes gene_type:complete
MASEWGILDFVCPLAEFRSIVNPDVTIFMNTIDEGRYEDTNKLFEPIVGECIEVREWIDLNQLRSSLEGFNRGIEGIQNYLNGPFQKLVK